MRFHPVEPALAAALLAGAALAFWLRFGKVLHNIRRSKSEPGYAFRPAGPRIRRLLAEVLGQLRVITERPVPGIAHAIVFWGFCAFAVVSVDHLAASFGGASLGLSGFGRAYMRAVAGLALAVGVAIAALAVRR